MRTAVSAFFCPSRRAPNNTRNFDNNNDVPLVLAAAAGGDYSANAGTYFNYSAENGAGVDGRQAGPIFTFSAVRGAWVTDGLSQTFAIGERHITPERLARLRRAIPAAERARLLKDLRFAPAWMHPHLRAVAGASC
jgi:hypothetical protein